MFTCVNMYSAIQTVRYGPVSRCSSLYDVFNGASPELYDNYNYVHVQCIHVIGPPRHLLSAIALDNRPDRSVYSIVTNTCSHT